MEADHEDAVKFWKEDMTKMHLGTKMLFCNDFAGAESVFRNGMMNDRPDVNKAELRGYRDLRGAFALQYGLVSVIKGVASLANDQLDECLQRLWYAEELASKDSEWLGKSVVRGICTLMGGVIQCLQHSFVKGVYNVLKSWLWIKVLQTEAVNYVGKEREVVRSCALFTLGIFNVLLSLLPTSMLRAATFLSGFNGDRDLGLKMMLDCWHEDGMFSPWAALIWVGYNVDTKAFLDETLSEDDLITCGKIFHWSQEMYPNSVFFSGIEADFEACRKNVALSIEIVDRVAPYTKELKALEWAMNYKRGVYELTNMHFGQAAIYFENSLQVYVRVGRRSMVPFMAMYSALCYMVVAEQKAVRERLRDEEETSNAESGNERDDNDDDDEEDDDEEDFMDSATAAAHAEEMLSLVAKYKAMNKDNWGRQDKWAFRLYREYDTLQEEAESTSNKVDEFAPLDGREPWPLLDLIESMIWRMRCTRWMDDLQTAQLLQLLQAGQSERKANTDDEIRLCACFAQVLIEKHQIEAALEWCEKGLSMKDEISAYGKESGFVGMLLYLKALIMYQRSQLLSAKHCLTLLDGALDNKKTMIYHYLLFKSNILKKQLNDVPKEEAYENVDIPAGSSHQVVINVEESERIVSWDWAVTKHDIQFTVIFRPHADENADIVMVESIERHDEKAGPCVGYFTTPESGDMIFEWDNRYSFLRSKQVTYRITQLEFDENPY